ncbi:c-type cytochrome [Chryseobacterium sp.]|uniref:c-type cytochrome n=1 Tax=Chryseobacterium sp. TaxID=1871047 RepID=UPI0025C21EAD|nr:c-type cytochrome [Chryseobacterium sp.]MBV8327726.1 c-type cytochrome [Chryseobacterium sp.]
MKSQFLSAIILPVLFILCYSCSGKDTTPIPQPDLHTEQPLSPSAETPAPPVSVSTSSDPGWKLIEGADCLACHKTDAKLIGPSYQEVADKYTEADLERLARKIIDGGKGNWGDIPMTPHQGITQDHAKQMVKYILSLKK